MKKALLLLFLILCGINVFAVPTLNGYVTDNAHVLSSQDVQQLTDRLTFLEQNTSVEIAIVTVPDTEGNSKSNYASLIGENNGVGKSATDNGVVILWVEGEEHGGFIATGRGIESILTDSTVGSIGRSARPYFDQKQYGQGFNKILDGIESQIKTDYQTAFPTTEADDVGFGVLVAILVAFFLIIFFIAVSEDMSSGSGGSGRSLSSSSYVGTSISRGGFSSSSSSGGFSGFGGGSFGGGGASF